jgi:hypothetical protein
MSVFLKILFLTAFYSACISCGDGGILNAKKDATTDIGTSPETCDKVCSDKNQTCCKNSPQAPTPSENKILLALQELKALIESLKFSNETPTETTPTQPCPPPLDDAKIEGLAKIIWSLSEEKQKLKDMFADLQKKTSPREIDEEKIEKAAVAFYTKTKPKYVDAYVELTGYFITFMNAHAPLLDACYSDDIHTIETGCIALYSGQTEALYDTIKGF